MQAAIEVNKTKVHQPKTSKLRERESSEPMSFYTVLWRLVVEKPPRGELHTTDTNSKRYDINNCNSKHEAS